MLDAEVRAIKKAVRSLDAADKHIQAKEAEKAIAEANRAKAALEGLDPKTVSKLDEYRSTLSRLATAYLDLGATIKGMDVLDRFTKAFAEDVPGAKLGSPPCGGWEGRRRPWLCWMDWSPPIRTTWTPICKGRTSCSAWEGGGRPCRPCSRPWRPTR